jgi:mannonate dehydratase
MGSVGVAAIPPAARSALSTRWPILEGPGTPVICLDALPTGADMRRAKQLGVNWALGGGLPLPWQEAGIRACIESYRAGGMNIVRLAFPYIDSIVLALPDRDEQLDKLRQSIRAAGRAGLKLIEYNFYVQRASEGYYEETGRAGAGYTAYDYDRVKGLPPLPGKGTHTADELWKNAEYMLKAIVPVAVESGIRLAIHPNDPPSLMSHGSPQILATFAGWKRYLSLVDSPSNGLTYDCGVSRELGEDPVEVCRYLGSRDRINHVHFRNVRVRAPYDKYTEVFVDEGQVDMFAVMKELVRVKYTGAIFPEHPRALDYDREQAKATGGLRGYPGGGGYAGYVFSVAYTRAMLQAALSS